MEHGAGAQPPDYQFDLGDQVPGRYRIEASVEDDKKQTYSASQIIEMRENSGEITLALAPAVDVKGHFRMEGQGGQQKNGFEIRLAQGGAMRRGNISAHAASDGSFTLLQVPPGEWELTVDTIARGGFLKSVFLGDKDVIFSRIQIEPGSTAELNIVASMNSAKIDGEVDSRAPVIRSRPEFYSRPSVAVIHWRASTTARLPMTTESSRSPESRRASIKSSPSRR